MPEHQGEPGHDQTRNLSQLFIDSVTDYAMFLLDARGYVRTWNEGARRIKGYEAHEIIGKHFSTFYPEIDLRRKKPQFELAAAEAEGSFEDEAWRIRKDGTRFWANVIITALFEDGKLVGFGKITRDLTQRRQAEEEKTQLLHLERTAREEAEGSLDRIRVLQDVTEAALAFLPLDDLLQQLLRRVASALSTDTAAILLLQEDQLVPRAAIGIEEEVEQGIRVPMGAGFAGRVAAERRPVVVDVNSAQLVNPLLRQKGIQKLLGVPLIVEGRVIGVLHVGCLSERQFSPEDVSLLQLVGDRAAMAIEHARLDDAEQAARRQRDSAEALVAERDRFLSVAAHELKTPVTSIRGLIQLVERRVNRPDFSIEDVRDSVATLSRQSAKLAQLTNELLDVSRLGVGHLHVEQRPYDVGTLADEVVKVMRLQGGSCELTLNAQEGLIGNIDPLRLEQVLINLIDNAIKFSPGGGRIEVSVKLVDGQIEMSVRDHGLGIPPEHRPNIFNRFYQAHAESHRSGMGLGLAISREIIELHHGTLIAEFPSGGGTRMVARLPLESAQTVTPDSAPGVLVVDDDDAIRNLVLAALGDEGLQARAAGDGAEALRIIREWQPTLILLDMRMPIMDGWEFARAYANMPGPHAPIVVMMAAADAGLRAKEIGARQALGKPFELSELVDLVESYAEAGGASANRPI